MNTQRTGKATPVTRSTTSPLAQPDPTPRELALARTLLAAAALGLAAAVWRWLA